MNDKEVNFPFGKTESEHNAFCDSLKCKHGNYCNAVMGLCSKCIMEKGTLEQKEELKKRSELCFCCGRIIGLYDEKYTHNYTNKDGTVCNVCKKEKKDLLKKVYDFNNNHRFVNICAKWGLGDRLFEIESFGVNWSALGTVGVEDAKDFIKRLNEAIELVKELNDEVKD